MSTVFDTTACQLGEGAFWHPMRQQFFWVDLVGKKLHTHAPDGLKTWTFPTMISAIGWVDENQIVITTETAFHLFNLETGTGQDIAPLESDNPVTRANDGRVDPFGGFWIGTMGKQAEDKAGAIYRYYRGEVRQLFPGISIPNSICFSPDAHFAYFTDSREGLIMRQALDQTHGWPKGAPEVFVDLSGQGWVPDGSVVDAEGNLWNAQWGNWRVAGYSPVGAFVRAIGFDAAHTTCPAFGGPDLTTLFCTSALQGITEADRATAHHGMTFQAEGVAAGQAEYRLIL